MSGGTAQLAAELTAVLARQAAGRHAEGDREIGGAGGETAGDAALARARALSVRLLEATAGDAAELIMDEGPWRRLLQLAGPDDTPELLRRLEADLHAVDTGLRRALAEASAAELRARTHVLIGLAGAVGATFLQHLAEALNGAAHDGLPAETEALGRLTLAQLRALSLFLTADRAAAAQPGGRVSA